MGGASDVTLRAVRLALVRELETINHYAELAEMADEPSVKQLMLHLMDEEKEHVAELTETLRRFDPRQDVHFGGDHAAAIGGAGIVPTIGAKAPPGTDTAVDPPAPPRSAPRSALTVGALFGQNL